MRQSLLLASAFVIAALASQSAAQVPLESDPLAPSWLRVNARITRLEREAERLRSLGMDAEADALRGEAQHFRNQLGRIAPSRATESGLDIVTAPGAGPMTVDVWPTERPVVLALSSHAPVDWTLKLQEGARVEQILLLGEVGDAPSRIVNAPAGVPVQSYDSLPLASTKDWTQYPRTARALYDLTGLSVSTFQSGVASSSAVYVGAGGEWTYQNVLKEILPLYERVTAYERDGDRAAAEGLRFTGLLRTPPEGSNAVTTVREFDAFSVRGAGTTVPIDTFVRQLAVDTESGRRFGLSAREPRFGGSIGEIDSITGALVPLPSDGPDAVAPPTRAGALAFDTRRNRLVATTLASPYSIYAYTPEDERWSVIGTGDHRLDFATLTYSEAHDALFGLAAGSSDIVRLDHEGKFVAAVPLSDVIPSNVGLQLFALGDKLGLLTPPYADLDYPHLPPEQRFLLIEPATGEVIYSGIVAIPEPGVVMLLAGASVLILGGSPRRSPR